ncbi:hypothetical protein LQ772_11655 [Frateuria edaphi]|uniref:hypothetical protein n=1 Tax=Frateuria edaphi TaxID=2898793 RepID=UPI001E2B2953|nr:hypothetical protein [Frateuria edaphi]UGB44643.1 hypothetical protein LQ772_11655 [Frateuria edaphi]
MEKNVSFQTIAAVEKPGAAELDEFVLEVQTFLGLVVTSDRREFSFLWENHLELQSDAIATFNSDVSDRGVPELRKAIAQISEDALDAHGLQGRPLRFKFRVLSAIAGESGLGRERKWFKKMVDAIDAILDSLIAAAGGAGGLIKEFKDALRALA